MNLGFGGFKLQPVCLFTFVSTDCDAKMEQYFLISIAPLKKVLKNTRFSFSFVQTNTGFFT